MASEPAAPLPLTMPPPVPGKPRARNSSDQPANLPLAADAPSAVPVTPLALAPLAAPAAASSNPQTTEVPSSTPTVRPEPQRVAAQRDNDVPAPPQAPAKLAFALTLKPLDPTPAPNQMPAAPVAKPLQAPLPQPATKIPTVSPDDAVRPEAPSPPTAAKPTAKQPDASPDVSRRQPSESLATPAPGNAPANHAAVTTTPGPQPTAVPPPVSPAVHTAPPQPSAPAASAPLQPPPAPSHGPAHDITLQVGGEGEQRVEVRLTERGGDVFVAVRTPDGKLAGDLRQNLPNLATRLEQSGFHAATWQPAADSERQRLADPQAGASGQDAQGQPRQNGRDSQRDPQQQKQPEPENPARPSHRKETGKDFAWLLSSIR